MISERNADERQAEGERDAPPKPSEFRNDPADPANPNEVREKHLKKVNKLKEP